MADQTPVTQLLARWSDGDSDALDELTPHVYDELKKLANSAFRREHGAHTLQSTALVNEAYLQLVGADIHWKSRSHFYALCARMMRRILVNHANAKAAEKRGGDLLRVTLVDDAAATEDRSQDVLDLDRALAALAEEDERTAGILELHYFGGMTYKEAGEVLDVSEATAKRSLKFGKAWLRTQLDQQPRQ